MGDLVSRKAMLAPWTVYAVLVLLSACVQGPTQLNVELADNSAGVVVVHGLSDSAKLVVRVGESLPPLAGRTELVEGGVRFTPRYPVEGIPALLVTVGERRWTLPLAAPKQIVPTTRVTAIHPSAPVVPANQLRWYLEFSAPMREGSALAHVRLRDQSGVVVEKAFLEVDEELWDPTRTRLTLMFDMGRVKQGIQSRVDLGAVLVTGRRYALEIDSTWVDARGVRLVRDTVHRFAVAGERHTAVKPSAWRVGRVVTGGRTPLKVDFGTTLDHALAKRMIAVTSADGERVGGALRLVNHDRALEFTPTAPWTGGRHQLRVHPALEDIAGNRVGHAFDAELPKGERAGVNSTPVVLAIPQ